MIAKEVSIQRINLNELTPESKKVYQLLTTPHYRCCLDGIDPTDISDATIVAIEATDKNGKPIGLALGAVYSPVGWCEIFSVYVDEGYRNQGIGTELLRTMENAFVAEKGIVLIFRYRKNDPSAPFFEKMSQSLKWAPPEMKLIYCFYDCFSFHPPWYEHPPKLPAEFEEFPWVELTAKEREQVENEIYNRVVSTTIAPPFEPDEYESINSLGLRFGERVIGWMITKRVSHDTIKYDSLYINPDYQRVGYSIRLLVDSIKLQQQSPVRWSIFEVNTEEVDSSWIKFVQRRLAPYAQSVDELLETWKSLK